MSRPLTGACIIGQSGGPTSVINASAYGVINTALASPYITRVLGASHGITGVLDDKLFDMGKEDDAELALMLGTPSSVLGSCRFKLAEYEDDPATYERILEIFKKYDVRYFFYNGGNDSMDTCNKVSKFMDKVGYECRIIGVPKTIDNDLALTDHCPGYGSAAKYIATTMMELYLDAHVYNRGMICVVEVMGRNAGWLTAATALAKHFGHGPDLIYLPEHEFELGKFMQTVGEIYKRQNNCLIAMSEGIHDKEGNLIADYGKRESQTDAFGHRQLGGLAVTMAGYLSAHMDAKIRGIELSLLQRCASHCASQTDVDEAYIAGRDAVEYAVAGATGKMVGFDCKRSIDGYKCHTTLVDLDEVANKEKKLPLEWILPDGSGVTQDFIDYALPLIQGESLQQKENGLPRFAKLNKVFAK